MSEVKELRPYQSECVDIINNLESGSYLVAMATGLGKTVVFSHLKRRGRVLILSHRDELVHQPEKYFECSFGVEQAKEHSNGEEVVSASVQSLVRRLNRFSPDDFDMIITDEAHHAVAASYQKIYDYFKPRLHIGFTATPNRGDRVRLDKIYEKIIYQKDLKWGIHEHYLTDIDCYQVDIGYDISKVKRKMGDFDNHQLAKAIDQKVMNEGIAKAYEKYAVGQTVIFATSVEHAVNIASLIPGAVVVTGATKHRDEIIKKFTNREIPCIVNCMVFTEGTDIPLIETIIIARPTTNTSLYIQMVGRGLRLYKGKKILTLIDCVGVTGKLNICTAPSLLGLDTSAVPKNMKKCIKGKLTDMEQTIAQLSDNPDAWVLNSSRVDLFSQTNDADLQGINWTLMYDQSLLCSLGKKYGKVLIFSPNELGLCDAVLEDRYGNQKQILCKDVPLQNALNTVSDYLHRNCVEAENLWNLDRVRGWGEKPISEKQEKLISTLLKKAENVKKYHADNYDVSNLNMQQASAFLNHLLN